MTERESERVPLKQCCPSSDDFFHVCSIFCWWNAGTMSIWPSKKKNVFLKWCDSESLDVAILDLHVTHMLDTLLLLTVKQLQSVHMVIKMKSKRFCDTRGLLTFCTCIFHFDVMSCPAFFFYLLAQMIHLRLHVSHQPGHTMWPMNNMAKVILCHHSSFFFVDVVDVVDKVDVV